MRGTETVFLSKNFLKSQGFLFYVECFVIFIVFFVVTIVLSLMNGLQENQFDSIKNVSSFPLIIKNIDSSDYENLLNLTECQSGNIKIYPYNDYRLLSKNNNKTAVLRVSDSSYFQSEVFKNYFYFFPIANNDKIIVPYTENARGDVYYYIQKGESTADIIESLDVNESEIYYPSFSSYESIFYKKDVAFLQNNKLFNVGILGSDNEISLFSKTLNALNYNLSSYRTEMKDVYSALVIENTMLILVMLFLILIVFLSFEKSIRTLILKRKGEVVLLLALGKSRIEVFILFLFSYTLPLLISEGLSVFLGILCIKSGTIQKLLSLFNGTLQSDMNLLFLVDGKELTYMVFISFLIYLILVSFSINSISKSGINEVSKE